MRSNSVLGGTVDEKTSSKAARRTPTLKQRRFAAAYADPALANGNGVVAARAAGYKGNARQLAVQASVNLRNRNVHELIASTVDGMMEDALQRLAEALAAHRVRSFATNAGQLISTPPEPDHNIRLKAIDFLFRLHAKFGATSQQVADIDRVDREDAIEAARQCLELFAPNLLAPTVRAEGKDREIQEHANERADLA